MTKTEIIAKLKALNLPKNSYVVFGSGPLAAAGIREAKDIDLLVSKALFSELKKMGWEQLTKSPDDRPLVHDVFEAHENWDFSPYSPTLEQLLSTVTIADDVPFASLAEVRKWKMASGNPRHLIDVGLIDTYLAAHK